MRESIKKQLKACLYARPTEYDPETNTYFIPKYIEPTFDIGKCYLVRVAKYLVNNKASVTASNWNKGTAPAYEYLKVYVAKTAGCMLYLNTIAYDLEKQKELLDTWSGWISIDDLEQLRAF